MVTRAVKVRSINGVYLVTLPKDLREIVDIKPGDTVLVTATDRKTVTVTLEEKQRNGKNKG